MDESFDLSLHGKNAVLAGHRVGGEQMLPGLAYPDLLFRLAWRKKNLSHRNYRLERLVIAHPIVVTELGSVRLQAAFTKLREGWRIHLSGCEVDAQGKSSEPRFYMSAELLEGVAPLDRQIDISAFQASSAERIDLNEVYRKARQNGLNHSGVMRAVGAIYVHSEVALVELSVDPQHESDCPDALCHPALMDGAAMASAALGGSARRSAQEDLFIPLAYDSFRLTQPLQSRCYALIDLSTFKSVNEICKLDIDFFDEQGRQVAALQGLTAKKVRHQAAAAPMQSLIRGIFAKYLKVEPREINASASFFDLGFQSADLVSMLTEIEAALGARLSPALLFEHVTLDELSEYLSREVGRPPPVPQNDLAAAFELRDLTRFSPEDLEHAMQAAVAPGGPRTASVDLALILNKCERVSAPFQECYRHPEGLLIRKIEASRIEQGPSHRLAALLQAIFDLATFVLSKDQPAAPHAIERVSAFQPLGDATVLISKKRFSTWGFVAVDVYALSAQGEVIAEIASASVRAMDGSTTSQLPKPRPPESGHNVMQILEHLRMGVLTPGQAYELMGEE